MPSNRKKATRIDQDRKDVVFHHDNATSLATRQKLRELGWEVLMHPPYSPDLALSDYHLFRSLQNFLNGVKFTSKEACENHLSQFFVQKSQKFYRRDYGFTSKMAEDGRTKRHIFGLILYLKYEKNFFHFCIKIRRNFFLNPI